MDNETRQAIAHESLQRLEQAERLIKLHQAQSRLSEWLFRLCLLIILLIAGLWAAAIDIHSRLRAVERSVVSTNH